MAKYDLVQLVAEFQAKMGKHWPHYQMVVSRFLLGKLLRQELVQELLQILDPTLVGYHNRFLVLNLTNLTREGPQHLVNSVELVFLTKQQNKTKQTRNGSYEKIKADIMALPPRERRRIKNITRESGKRGMITSSITLTRQALLPKVPYVQDKQKQLTQPNNTLQWLQEVVAGYQAPLALETRGLPEPDSLRARITMHMRENGLLGQVDDKTLLVMSVGLEYYLKNLLEGTVNASVYRDDKYGQDDYMIVPPAGGGGVDGQPAVSAVERAAKEPTPPPHKKRRVVVTAEDLFRTIEILPHLSEPCGPWQRLLGVVLQNDDSTLRPYEVPEQPVLKKTGTANGDGGSNVGSREELKWMLHEILSSN